MDKLGVAYRNENAAKAVTIEKIISIIFPTAFGPRGVFLRAKYNS